TSLTETYDNANVGSGKTLSVATYTVNDGNGGLNYTVTLVTNTNGLITPLAPSSLAVTAGSAYGLNFTWTNNAGNVDGYKLERATDAAFTQNVTVVATPSSTSTTDVPATGSIYYYRVRTTQNGVDSGNSVSVTALALPGTGGIAHQYGLSLDATGTTVQVSDYTPANSTTLNYSVPMADLSALTLSGGPLADQLTLDLSHGNPLPTGGSSFDGLAGTDHLILTGSLNGQNLSLNATQLQIGSRTLNYSNLETLLAQTDLGATGTRPDLQISQATLISPSSQTLGQLTLNPGGTVQIAALGSRQLDVNTPVFAGGTLDLADNQMLAHSLAQPDLQAALFSGYALGAWTGTGLISSTARTATGRGLGYLSGTFYNALHADSTLAAGDTIVQYTWQGDVNLDHQIAAIDFAQLDVAQLKVAGGTPNTGFIWLRGDFNYDGQITTADFTAINAAYAAQNTPPLAQASTPAAAPMITTAAPLAAAVTSTAVVTLAASPVTAPVAAPTLLPAPANVATPATEQEPDSPSSPEAKRRGQIILAKPLRKQFPPLASTTLGSGQ
ncbi:MAG: hypothetical protein WCI73_02175, partial [Phycisphaerae bacterium]